MSEESGKKQRTVPEGLDMIQRDPMDMNAHVKTLFEDVIGEPEGAHSDDCVWINAFKCFNGGKKLCYTCLTFVCALPLSLCWGCQFACLTFCHIWSVTPCYRVFNINFICFRRFFSTLVHCCCDPLYESIALMFTKIHVTNVTGSGEYVNTEYNALTGVGKAGERYEV